MISVVPTKDIQAINRLINHPDIAPHVRDDSIPLGQVDISCLNPDTNAFFLVMDSEQPVGFVIMLGLGCHVYEQHSGMLKTHRGHNALRAGREVLRLMFESTDCLTISTWAWASAKHVIRMAKALGFVEGQRMMWPNTVNGQRMERVMFSQSIRDWKQRNQQSASIQPALSPCL